MTRLLALTATIAAFLVLPASALANPLQARTAYWRLSESSGTTAADSVGSNPGTYAGGYTLGQAGATADGDAAVSLNGSTGRIETSYSPFASGSARSFEGWARRRSDSTTDALFGGDGTAPPILRTGSGTAAADIVFAPNYTTPFVTWTGVLPATGSWFHWVLVYDDATRQATLYINGASKGTQTIAAGYSATPGNLQIGARNGTSVSFDGYLDDVAVYSRALSADEVGQLYTAPPNCSQTLSPGANVATAVQNAAAGAVICLAPGTYTSPGTNTSFPAIGSDNGTASAPVTLTSRDPYNPALLSGRFVTQGAVSHLEVSRLKFTWNAPDENTILLRGSDVTLRHNDISGASKTICVATGSADGTTASTSSTIDRNKIHDCGSISDASDQVHAQGVYANPATSGLRVSNNWCYRVAARCYQERYGQNDVWTRNVADYENWGFIFGDGNPAPSNDSMTFNISGPHHYEYGASGYSHGGDLVEDLDYVGSGNSFTDNCWGGVVYFNHSSSPGLTIANNTIGTPVFADPVNGDFHLKVASPCRGFGPRGSSPGL